MKSKASADLSELYRQLLLAHPLQHATLVDSQHWTWIDTLSGGETLLLLPGFMGEAETSFLFIQALAARLRILSVSYPPSVGQVDGLCDGLCALLDHLNVSRTSLLGGSTSGFLAQAFVRRYPDRTDRLILTHTGLPSPDRARTARIYLELLRCLPFALARWGMHLSVYTFFPRRTPVHAFWRRHFQEGIRRQTLDSIRNRFALMSDFHSHSHFQPGDWIDRSRKILIMEMSRDHLTDPAEQAALRAVYPSASLHIFPDTAHYDSIENPEEQIRVIMEFMTQSYG